MQKESGQEGEKIQLNLKTINRMLELLEIIKTYTKTLEPILKKTRHEIEMQSKNINPPEDRYDCHFRN